ncbi:cell envelope biogenesis protein OmpA [Yeosuana aromativorans]|uniref:Cell envelope biogenesis protein OmpA n=1 Tax=Yeosuana aromativorans TaxID=288019 RepID=A0A8J3FIR0_9FLAO|nr:OmpA family protein [Yeosuana aromativorans]GGK34540.1 cell envelope biogenesis protein OmpA [Yeosuana aromativorans]
MKPKKHILIYIILLINAALFAQYGKQKKADALFNKFSFVNASEVYETLLEKNFNADYAVRQLGDCYAYMRNPDSAAVYYKKAVEQNNVPKEYYYRYAQSLRGIKDYKESRVWLKKFKDAGGELNNEKFMKDADFITTIFNAKPQYFLKTVNFNSKYSDFGAFEYGDKLYFTSSRDEGVSTKHTYGWDGQPFLDVYVKDKNDSVNVINHKYKLKGKVNSVYHDGPITITNDGKTMYFSRNNFNKNTLNKDKKGISNLKIYKATLVDGSWTNIEDLPFNSDEYSTGHPALNSDNTKLYFASDMPGSIGGSDIYYVDINSDGSYGSPKNLGDIVNTKKNEVFPFVNSEGTLFFSSDGHQGLGLLDIFAAITDKNNNITGVLNLGVPVNSSKDDFSFFMNTDGTSGYFASNRDGGVGSDDIYAYNRLLPLKLEGTVTDAINNKPIANATVSIFDGGGNKMADLETDADGYYEINIDRNADYKLLTSHQKYEDQSRLITSKNIDKTAKRILADFSLNPLQDVVKLAELNTIYFGFEKYDIRKDAALELDKIVNMMTNIYPNMIIRIESHTDSRGTTAFNDWLSQKRAKATFDYLISKGIDPSRITKYEGFGERRLTNGCDGSVPCTEEEHQLNRRTEFIVIKMK